MTTTKNMKSIGIVQSPFKNLGNMPIQPVGARDVEGAVIVDRRYAKGLKDLDGFSHIYLIYVFHKVTRVNLVVKPFMDVQERGVFATRSPLRPTHIGLSIVELLGIKGNKLTIRGCDMLDRTPVLDIKPYIPLFDGVRGAKSGWMKASRVKVRRARSDGRFV